jgi:hypothetical protein
VCGGSTGKDVVRVVVMEVRRVVRGAGNGGGSGDGDERFRG